MTSLGCDRFIRRCRSLAVACAALAFVLAGTARAADAPQSVTFAIATADINIGYPFAHVPLALGYFADEGLDVKVVPGQSSAATLQLLLSGRADLGVVVPDPAMIQRAKLHIPVVSIYAISRRSSFHIAVLPDSPIRTLEDLIGKRIGADDLAAGSMVYFRARLREAGIDESAMQFVATGYGSPGAEALKNGAVDASVSFGGGFMRRANAGYLFRFLPDAAFQDSVYSYNVYATEQYIADHPDVIEKIGRAMAKGTVFLKTNPAASVHLFWKLHPDRAPKDPNDAKAFHDDLAITVAGFYDMRLTDLPVDFPWGSQDEKTFAQMQDILVHAHLIDAPIKPTDYFDARFQDAYQKFDHDAVVKQAQSMQ